MKKVLIIDDSEVNLYLIQSIFDDDPDIVTEIESNSRMALVKMNEGHPDVVILDLMMPHIDGFQLLEKIKVSSELKDIPVVVISAKHDIESIERVKSFGIYDYIKKPINLVEVENIIRSCLVTNKIKNYPYGKN